MANPEHLEILKHGVQAWNKWRVENPDIEPDLRGAEFGIEEYGITEFRGANFSGANLLKVQFVSTYRLDSDDADTLTNLTEVDFSGANLWGALFEGVILRRARFRDANLVRAEFSDTELEGAAVEWSQLNGTRFISVNLTNVIGLDKCRHYGPSILDYRTLQISKDLPIVFLRGCGLPDLVINNLAALREDPIEFYSCFISYSSKDQTFAERLHADLQSKGVRCWFAPEDLKIGDKFRDQIDESIRLHDKLLLILSEHSVSSPWVSNEVEAAIEREHREGRTVLFPIMIDEAVMESEQAWAASIRRTRHIGDFTRWKDYDSYHKAFERLLRDLKAQEKKA